MEFAWFAPTEHTFPSPFHEIFSGNLSWSLNGLPDLITAVRGWVDDVFPDPTDPYDRVWHHKLPFMEVGNGDYLALDVDEDTHGRVVYLSHDDGEGHGRTMAASFEELLIRWIPRACPGAEDWQWLPFLRRIRCGHRPLVRDSPRVDCAHAPINLGPFRNRGTMNARI
ncbi:MAG: hypothetical protein AUI15_30075 [Actinobacteria bacterium 13_2_20CM_2_66_6]|nr:MAG: hypothetical protein AUI15_30075 [Actinobacteria bacterium 13_2_20CM_2_66_6]